ncbi:hypothetical protein K435DRAFT_874930 [Dendrothele bispora CBS 962.96]|uniref:Uncharacterized protein n=1 Tax=Dendrothele bispora (strain CBS 962.96) TaxID=1314807 RepID=A0A4S8KVH0_DENBC|nr:hypothetical protein K435DRAFT_874930 [Dendrothele bispora CBS 962.96]
MTKLKDIIANKISVVEDVKDIHLELSSKKPNVDHDQMSLEKSLKGATWAPLAYICNNVMALPEDLAEKSELRKRDITKQEMVNALVHWCTHDVEDDEEFQWPFFTSMMLSQPEISWAQ